MLRLKCIYDYCILHTNMHGDTSVLLVLCLQAHICMFIFMYVQSHPCMYVHVDVKIHVLTCMCIQMQT